MKEVKSSSLVSETLENRVSVEEPSTYRATLTAKGKVTIPAPARERLGFKNGAVLEFIPDGEALRVKVVRRYSAHELLGILKSDVPYPGSVEEEQHLVAEAHVQLLKQKS